MNEQIKDIIKSALIFHDHENVAQIATEKIVAASKSHANHSPALRHL